MDYFPLIQTYALLIGHNYHIQIMKNQSHSITVLKSIIFSS